MSQFILFPGSAGDVIQTVSNTSTINMTLTGGGDLSAAAVVPFPLAGSAAEILKLHRTTNTNGHQVLMDLQLNNSSSATTTYAQIGAEIQDNTAGAEIGDIVFKALYSDNVLYEAMRIDGNTDNIIAEAGGFLAGSQSVVYGNNSVSFNSTAFKFQYPDTFDSATHILQITGDLGTPGADGTIYGFFEDGSSIVGYNKRYGMVVYGQSCYQEIATPSNPPANWIKLYPKSGDKLYTLTSGGSENAVITANLPIFTGNMTTTGQATIGSASIATDGQFVVVGGSGLSGTSNNGIVGNILFSSGVTVQGIEIVAQPRTAAAAFTMQRLYGFYASDASLGAASAVTRQVQYGGDIPTKGSNNAFVSDDTGFSGNFGIYLGTSNVSRFAAQVQMASLGVGNSAAATTPGSVVKKVELFDNAGVSLGFVAIYDAIT